MHVERKGRGLDQIKNNYGSLSGQKMSRVTQYFGRLNSVYLKSTPADCEAKPQNHKTTKYAFMHVRALCSIYDSIIFVQPNEGFG
jgi:hypothetical protein